MSDLFSDAAEGRAASVAPLPQRVRPRTLDELVGQAEVLGPGTALHRAIEDGRSPSMILHGPPGRRQDDDRADRRGALVGDFEELTAVSARVDDVRGVLGARARAPRRERAADAALHRRDPSLRQAPAGLRPPRSRGGPGDADRRDDREPVLRGEPGASLALHRDRASAAHAGRARAGHRAGRRASWRPSVSQEVASEIARRAGGDARTALQTLELAWETAQRHGRRARRSSWSTTSRASVRSATTGRATATTTSPRRSSSRCAAATRTPRSTTSPRCWREARIRASSRAGS